MKTYDEINEIAKTEEVGMRRNAGDQINTAFVHGFRKGEKLGYEEGYQQGLEDGKRQGVVIDGDKRYWKGYHAAQEDGQKIYQKGYEDGARRQDEVQYQQGFEDAWDMLKNVCSGGRQRMLNVFGTISVTKIITDNTATEAKAKIDAWKKRQTDDLKVGDEVTDGNRKGAVVGFDDSYCTFLDKEGIAWTQHTEDCKKTGRHFDGIVEVLKQMQE